MNPFFPVLLTALFVGFLVAAMLGLSLLLGPRRKSAAKGEPFETGMVPFNLPGDRFAIRFYVIAILFVIFDVELVFLFPWVTVFRTLGWFGFAEMAFFLAVLALALLYAWKKGALEWE
ncbi:MAG: NADH-quinone oxidoreductase subunit A [candidate division KSB1 bacterium]|nr:NADH-quinone oxidoreductase subunit A [candidate division KSB1 bacterium]